MKLPKDFKLILPAFGKYQEQSIGFGIIEPNPGLLLDMGLGKTYVALNISRYRIQKNNVNKILVASPLCVIDKWLEEIKEFTEYKGISLHHPVRKKRIESIDIFRKDNSLRFGLINYEALYTFFKYLKIIPIDLIIADESARYIKNLKQSGPTKFQGTKRALAIVALGDKARYRMILTGTPITNTPLDIWSQFRFKDKGDTFGTNFYAWRNYFFDTYEHHGYKKFILKKDRAGQLTKGIYKSCIRFKKEDVIENLPEKMYISLEIELEGRLRREYESVKKKVIAELETEQGLVALNIQHVFTKYIRLQQVTSGFIKNERGKYVKLISTPKLDTLMEEIDLILDLNESIIIWCRFLYSIDLISELLKERNIQYITMTGRDKDKTLKWRTFQTTKIPIFIGQVEAGGIGIELFKENTSDEYQHTIFYENTFVLDHREQALARSYGRIGQNAKSRIVDLTIKDTIDEKMKTVLRQNKSIADLIMEKGAIEFIK